MIRSVSGSRPVISISHQIRLNSFGRTGADCTAAASVVSVAFDIIFSSSFKPPFSHRVTMYSLTFSVLFVAFLFLSLAVRFWLGSRHIRHVLAHRSQVPERF